VRAVKQIWWWLLGGVGVIVIIVALLQLSSSQADYAGPSYAPRPTLGSAESRIVVEEFSDFQCPACKSAQSVVDDINSTFGDKIYFKYRHYPLVTIHTQAFRAALAAECANDQGKFWEFHDILFDKQPNFSRADLITYARQIDLIIDGVNGFAACLDSRAKTDIVRADMREGDQRGVKGTPTFFVNGEALQDWSKLKETIQAKLISD